MGDPSSLRFVPVSSSATPIDWSRVPEETNMFFIEYYSGAYDWEKQEFLNPLPATIGDLAKLFDERKFFGYFSSGCPTLYALMDISEFGLQPIPSNGREQPVGPRFYMTYIDKVWFLVFAPGSRECIVGYSDDMITNDDGDDDGDYGEAYYEKMAAEETAMAHAFDVKLEQEVSLGRGKMVESIQTLSGTTAWTVPYLHSGRMWQSYEASQVASSI